MTAAASSRELLGYERSLVVEEHMRWLAGRMPSEALRDEEQDPRDGDSPIAAFARGHRLAHAQRRSRMGWGSSNRKKFDRRDDAPQLVDEVT